MGYVFYTTQEVAELLKLNVLTIYEYIKAGDLVAVKFGRNYRVESQELDNFIKKHTIKPLNSHD